MTVACHSSQVLKYQVLVIINGHLRALTRNRQFRRPRNRPKSAAQLRLRQSAARPSGTFSKVVYRAVYGRGELTSISVAIHRRHKSAADNELRERRMLGAER